jgi:multidrug efflux system outer membrane protein
MNVSPTNDGSPVVKFHSNGVRLDRSKLVSAVGTAILLGRMICPMGCSGSRKIAKPSITAPPSWSSEGSETSHNATGDLSQWWSRFSDPELSDLIVRALKSNTSMRTARSRVREARAQARVTSANLYPSVTGSSSVTGSKSSPASASSSTFSGSLDASWEADIFGANRSALKGAKADLSASEGDLGTAQVSLVAEIATDYVSLRSYQVRLEIARTNEASEAETLQLTEWREQAGLVSATDVEQARSNLEQTRASIPTLETSVAESEHRIAILLGLTPGALKNELAGSTAIPSVPDSIAIGIPAETLRQRPDVRSAEQKIIAETARLRQKEAARYPSFSLSGSLGIERLLGGSSIGAIAGSTVTTLRPHWRKSRMPSYRFKTTAYV